jgi:hypothetical protein
LAQADNKNFSVLSSSEKQTKKDSNLEENCFAQVKTMKHQFSGVKLHSIRLKSALSFSLFQYFKIKNQLYHNIKHTLLNFIETVI